MVTLQGQSRRETMTSAERMSAITRGDRPDRIPVLPFSGGFCASIVGYPIRSIYDDPERLWAQTWARELLGLRRRPLILVRLVWRLGVRWRDQDASERIGPGSGADQVSRSDARGGGGSGDPRCGDRRPLPLHIEFAEIQRQFGVPVMVPAWGPFTAAANIVGVDVLCRWMIRQPEVVHLLLSKVVAFAKKIIDYFVDRFRGHTLSGAGGCATSSNQLISPRQFEEFVLPHHSDVYGHLAGKGIEPVFCHICGEQSKNLPLWAQVPFGERGILSFGEEVDLKRAVEIFGDKHIVAGNVETRLMAEGTWQDVYQQAKTCIDKAKYAPGGYVLMAGCDIPPSSPLYNIYALKKAVMDFGFYD